MSERPIRPSHTALPILLILGVLGSGCASLGNTPQQEYTLGSYEHCRTAARTNQPVTLNRVQPDGQYSYSYYSGLTSGPSSIACRRTVKNTRS
jgi:hypothetical protein